MPGRPPKQGIEYAGWNVDIFENEPKIDVLLDGQGWEGFAIYFYLCCRAYASEGYFYRWGDAMAPTTARRMGCGITSGKVSETVNLCATVGLFDYKRLSGYGILTSRGIQRRYLDATQKRTRRIVIREYWLLDEESSGGLVFRTENSNFRSENADFLPENATKESKVKESKVKESKYKVYDLPSVGQTRETDIDRPTDKAIEFSSENVYAYADELGVKNTASVLAFIETMERTGLRGKDGKPIRDWRAVFRKWTEKERAAIARDREAEDEEAACYERAARAARAMRESGGTNGV